MQREFTEREKAALSKTPTEAMEDLMYAMEHKKEDIGWQPLDKSRLALKTMPGLQEDKSAVSVLIDRVEKLISLLESPSSIIITGKAAIEEFEQLILRKAR